MITKDLITVGDLDNLAKRINAEHAQAEAAMREGLEHALKCGELLTQAKALVAHGSWLPWLTDHCTVSERTAQAYMRVYEHWPELGKSATVADLSFHGALALLVAPKHGSEPVPDLAALEAKIEKGKHAYIEVGQALQHIRDDRLYRLESKTFENFCLKRFGWSKATVQKYIGASQVAIAFMNERKEQA